MIRKRSLAALLLLITLLSASTVLLLPGVEATVESPSEVSDELEPMAVPDGTLIKYVTESPAELDQPPAVRRVVDEKHPAWVTYYGTKLGEETLPPRNLALESLAAGPEVPLGFWETITPFQGFGFNAMASAPDGRLFASQNSNGLVVYAPDTNGVYSWSEIDATPSGLASNLIRDLAIFNNELWVATSDAGVSRLALTDGTWETYDMSNSGLPTNYIERLTPVTTPEDEIYIWLSTPAGAVRFTPGSSPLWEVFTMSDGLPSNNITDIAVQFRLGFTLTWVSTDAGLRRWNGTSWANVTGGNNCLFDRATRIVIDHNGHAWLGAEKNIPGHQPEATPLVWDPIGVCRHRYTGLAGSAWDLFDQGVPGLPSNAPTDLSVDGANRVWMSFFGGAAVYDQGSWDIFTNPESPLASNNVRLVQAVDEMIWFGYGNTPALTRHTPNWTKYLSPSDTGGNGTPGPLLVEETTTWVGVGSGIVLHDGSSWAAHEIAGNSADVSALARDGEGTLWIGTAGNGLFAFDEVSTFTQQTTADGLPSDDIRALVSDYDGKLWVATAGGLALRGNGYWLPFTQATSPLPEDDLQALTVDSTNRLWIGTATSGIAILDPNGSGDAAWSTQTSADGLPSDTINGLTTDPAGIIWAATDAGLASYEPATQNWTLYQSNDGSIPSDEVLTVTSDPAGRLWVGTANGLAHFEANSWQPFHVPGSTLGSDQITDVASDGKRLWVTAGPVIAARGVITSPIGNFPPIINSFTPTQEAPLSQITINGSNFDARGPQYNEVYFRFYNNPTFQGQVLAATSSSLTVKVPLLARSGQISVKANGLNAISAEDFIVTPLITSLDNTCLGPGELLEIQGRGFTAQDNGVYVKIGDGEWRLADAWDASLVRHYIRPGDTSGPVYVRLGQNGPETTSPSEIDIITPFVMGTAIQQGIQDEQMIWGKRTLVQVFLRNGGQSDYCSARVTKAKLSWKKNDGTTVSNSTTDWATFNKSSELILEPFVLELSLDTGVNFVSAQTFPLSQFNGVSLAFWNGPVQFMTMDIPKTAFNFVDTQSNRKFISMYIGKDSSRTHEFESEFEKIAYEGFAHIARIYPQQDIEWRNWQGIIPIWMSFPFVNLDDEEDNYNYGEVRGAVDDYLDPGEDQFGMALVHQSLLTNNVIGKAPRGGKTGVTFNLDGISGYNFLHESLHLHDWVDSDSANHDDDNDGHSRYDEGQWENIEDCKSELTYRQALIDQTGATKRIIRLDKGKPYEFPLIACPEDEDGKSPLPPRSLISYAPARFNNNSFLEPLDYRFVLDELLDDLNRAPEVVSSPTLRLSGNIDTSDNVIITVSQVEEEGGTLSDAEPTSAYHLQLRDANDALLLEHPFNVPTEEPDGGPATSYRFNMRVPFPDETAAAALYHDEQLIWSQDVSSNAPSVSLTSPAGGTYSAEETIPVMWQASDTDGDALQFALDYSPDGQNWTLITPYLTESSFDWEPGFVLASNTARLRVRVSDGFNTASATSDAFILTPHAPRALIIEPEAGQEFTEGETIALIGSSITSDGYDEGEFEWQKNDELIGNTREMSHTLDTIGTYTFTLQVTSHNMIATDIVSVTVLADYDQDGMPNDWELSYSLNPLDASDVADDPDEDNLSNIKEYQLGTHPRQADTDSDNANDGDEVDAGTDPLNPNQTPPTEPVLNVGAEYLNFSSTLEQPIAGSNSTWITNGGPGDLSWSVSSDAKWLTISPEEGDAPTEVTISTDPTGLSAGIYEGHLTFSAPNATNSPQIMTITLNISSQAGPTPTPTSTPQAEGERIYLPLLLSR